MSDPQPRHWFYLLPQDSEDARLEHAARLTEKAWRQGDRIGLCCDSSEQAQALDERLWSFRPDAFLPHEILERGDQPIRERVGILLSDPAPDDWDTVIVLSRRLPACADQFARLALIASSDPDVLQQARQQFRQLRELGVEPQVHDLRSRHV